VTIARASIALMISAAVAFVMGSPFVSAQKDTSVPAWKKDSSVYNELTKGSQQSSCPAQSHGV